MLVHHNRALLLAFIFTVYAVAAGAEDGKTKPELSGESVQAVLETNPRTPADLARAADLIAELGEPELAKSLLKKILDADPDRRQLLELADRLNVAMFVKMAGNAALAPEAKQLADKIILAVKEDRGAPQRIDKLIKQLGDESPSARYRAMAALRATGSAAVEPLIRAMADPARSAQHRAAVRTTLTGLGSDATRPLVALLECDDPLPAAEAVQALSEAGANNATVFLLAPCVSPESPRALRTAAAAALLKLVGAVPERAQAARVLAKQARDYYQGRLNLGADENGMVTVWQWDAAQKRVVATKYPAEQAAVVLAARLAKEALSVAPNDKNVRTLRLATMLEKAALEAGIDTPLSVKPETATATAAEFGVAELQEVVRQSLPPGTPAIHPAAATAAVQILGEIGSPDELLYATISPGVLARAAHGPDARLRMAAVAAIVALKPSKPFAGASYVLDALEFAAATSGRRRVMLAGPGTERSRYIAGYLTALGYRVETAVTGSRMLLELAKSPDYELVLIDAKTERPAPHLLIQQLRHDWRLASLPVGVLAGEGRFEQAEHIVSGDPLAEAFSRPHDKESTAWQIERLHELAGSRFVPFGIRQLQAAAALELLAQLAADNGGAFNVSRSQAAALRSLHAPGLGEKAAAVLAGIGSPASQRALIDLAGRATQPLELRQAAMVGFRKSIQRHGILLTTEEIRKQYDRYNQSQYQDVATRKILGQILDCIEAPTKPVKAK